MRHPLALAACVLLVALSTAAIAGASRHRAHRAGTATLELGETNLGKVLVTSSGFTVFDFTKDKKNKDNCVAIMGCAGVWPPLEVSGMPTAGPGINPKKLGTIALPGGGKQVTYYGHPLYGYSGDSKPGETSYNGVSEFQGIWYVVNAKGKAVK
jgi:predicted lipoprotein with Yx(FWY)xxD motif